MSFAEVNRRVNSCKFRVTTTCDHKTGVYLAQWKKVYIDLVVPTVAAHILEGSLLSLP